ncbi:MAG: universal stress protein, partial [Bdellovibrionota bacterium]
LVNQASTQASAVEKLLNFAKQEGAAAIAVSSHGRSGLDRMFLGSFAEKVLETSPLPVFFLNHQPSKKSKQRDVVLFPTDFSDDSWGSFREFLNAASGGKIEVILFHAITYPLPLNTGMGIYLPDGYIEDQEKWARGEGTRWLEEAKKRDVKAEAVIRTGGVGFTSGDVVLEAAKEFGASAVVVTSNSNAVGRFLVGSIAYPVFRANQFLTMVYGPKARALHRANKEPFSFAEANG